MTTSPIGPVAFDATMQTIADDLLLALRDDVLVPSLVHLAPTDGDTFDLGLKPLEGAHPTDLLLGFVAPARWHAIGVVSTAWAYSLDERSTDDRRRHRTGVVALVSRSDEIATRVSIEDDPELSARLDAQPAEGEQFDMLRRVLRLPTPPPPCAASALSAVEWLWAIVQRADRDWTWNQVQALHPGVAALDAAGARTELPLAGRVFDQVYDWSRLRADVALGHSDVGGLSPRDAEWLDDGSFARYLLSRCPPLTDLREHLSGLLRPGLLARIDRTLVELGVPRPIWPDRSTGRVPDRI